MTRKERLTQYALRCPGQSSVEEDAFWLFSPSILACNIRCPRRGNFLPVRDRLLEHPTVGRLDLWKMVRETTCENACVRYFAYPQTQVLSSGCDGPGSRDQGAGARQTEQYSSTATGHEEGVEEELESRHARDEGGCAEQGLSLARSRPSPDGRYRGQLCEWVCS